MANTHVSPSSNVKDTTRADAAYVLLGKLREFVRARRIFEEGCKVLSLGDNCTCPLCKLDEVHNIVKNYAVGLDDANRRASNAIPTILGDWRDQRKAMDVASKSVSKFVEDPNSGYPTDLWAFVKTVLENYAPNGIKQKCVHCDSTFDYRQMYRCWDCKSYLCEACTPIHFGSSHKSHEIDPAALLKEMVAEGKKLGIPGHLRAYMEGRIVELGGKIDG